MASKFHLIKKNVCAWPNLFRFGEKGIGAVIFNAAAHGTIEGDLDFWATTDQGEHWCRLSTAAEAPPGQNRMHSCCGVRHDGTIDLLSTGFSVADGAFVRLEPLWHSCSRDNGATWEVRSSLLLEGVEPPCVAYGAIVEQHGKLYAAVYRSLGQGRPSYTWVIESGDGGLSWNRHSQVGNGDTNEAYLIETAEGFVAVVRTHVDHHLRLFTCAEGTSVWIDHGALTLPMQHPGHLLRLGNGGLLLTYGIRNKGLMGIGARCTTDLGRNWGAPFVLYRFPDETTDCGYPSTVSLDGDWMLTGAYTNKSDSFSGYQFVSLRWRLTDFLTPRTLESISDNRKLTI